MKILWIVILGLFSLKSIAQDADTIINKRVCIGKFTLVAPQLYYTNYQWILPDGSSKEGNSFTTVIDTPGMQSIRCIARDACTENVALFYVNIVTPLYRTVEVNADVNLYPIPTQDILKIDNPRENVISLQLTDITGKILLQQNLEKGHSEISLLSLSPGIFLYRITDNKGYLQKGKLVRQ